MPHLKAAHTKSVATSAAGFEGSTIASLLVRLQAASYEK